MKLLQGTVCFMLLSCAVKKVSQSQAVLACTLKPNTQEGLQADLLVQGQSGKQASLICNVSSKATRATQRNLIWNKT